MEAEASEAGLISQTSALQKVDSSYSLVVLVIRGTFQVRN